MCGEYEKSEDKEEEKYQLIKNAGVKGAITSKRGHNQTPLILWQNQQMTLYLNLKNKEQK